MQCCFWNLQEAEIIASACLSFAIGLFCFISIAEFFATNRFCCIIFCDDVMGLKGGGERAGRTGFAVSVKQVSAYVCLYKASSVVFCQTVWAGSPLWEKNCLKQF